MLHNKEYKSHEVKDWGKYSNFHISNIDDDLYYGKSSSMFYVVDNRVLYRSIIISAALYDYDTFILQELQSMIQNSYKFDLLLFKKGKYRGCCHMYKVAINRTL